MADFDYGRRRSDYGPARNRSRSPMQNRGYGNRAPESNKMVDPFIMTEHVSYDYFCRWFQVLNPGASIDESMRNRYNDYTVDLVARTARTYVAQQAALPYFKERYDGSQHCVNLKQDAAVLFKTDVENGVYNSFAAEVSEGAETVSMEEILGLDRMTAGGEPSSSVVAITSLPANAPRDLLVKHVEIVSGVKAVSVSSFPTDKKQRLAWIVLEEGTNIDEAIAKLTGSVLEDPSIGRYELETGRYQDQSTRKLRRLLWTQMNDEGHVEQHLAQVEEVIKNEEAKSETGSVWAETKQNIGDDLVRHLDVGIEYLRKVHAFDYWQLQSYDSVFDLDSHSIAYARPSSEVPASETSGFEAWSQDFNRKLQVYLDPKPYFEQLRQKPLAEAVSEIVQSKIKKEEETRYRCQVPECTKLFKDIPFVQKHIEKRHGDWIAQVTHETELLLHYLADPNKEPSFREYKDVRPRRDHSPTNERGRRRSSPQQNRNGYGGGGYRANARDDYRRPPAQNYRDLDRPAEELPELDY